MALPAFVFLPGVRGIPWVHRPIRGKLPVFV